MTSNELLQELKENLTQGVNCPSPESVDLEIDKLSSALDGVPESAKIGVLARLIEEYDMSGEFSGQSSDMPIYFSDERWAEIEKICPNEWKKFAQNLLSEGW